MAYVDYASLNTMEEFSFIAGSSFYLDFKIYDESNTPVEQAGITWEWKLSPYGQKDYTVLTKTNSSFTSPDVYTKRLTLTPSDTINFYGKYAHQVTVTQTILGVSTTYKPAQGVITIISAIK